MGGEESGPVVVCTGHRMGREAVTQCVWDLCLDSSTSQQPKGYGRQSLWWSWGYL